MLLLECSEKFLCWLACYKIYNIYIHVLLYVLYIYDYMIFRNTLIKKFMYSQSYNSMRLSVRETMAKYSTWIGTAWWNRVCRSIEFPKIKKHGMKIYPFLVRFTFVYSPAVCHYYDMFPRKGGVTYFFQVSECYAPKFCIWFIFIVLQESQYDQGVP